MYKIIEAVINVKKFEEELKALSRITKNKPKTYKVKITKDQMDLLYCCASFDIKNKNDFGNMLKQNNKELIKAWEKIVKLERR